MSIKTRSPLSFTLTSLSFIHEDNIPSLYTCEGGNISPPLKWENPPIGTKSFVLIMDDPDAPGKTWDHWILFNIPAKISEFEKNIVNLPNDAKYGKNSWGEMSYGGPCPPTGKHRYFFKIYALDIVLPLDDGASKTKILSTMQGHILDETELMGYYERKKS